MLAVSMLAGFACFALADDKQLQGMLPYKPSCIEWLAVRSQIKYGLDDSEILNYSMSITEVKNENAILISIKYDSKLEKILPKIKNYVEATKSSILLEAKANKWDWIVVKTHYEKEIDFFAETNKEK